MKKLVILSAVLALSACACLNSEDPEEEVRVAYQNPQPSTEDCDYFDGVTCYRYVRRTHQAPAVQYREPAPQPVVAPEPPLPLAAPAAPAAYGCTHCGCRSHVAPVAGVQSDCAPRIRETREPVEIVFKKTTFKTVYEPQTTSSVSYERMPYSQARVVSQTAPIAEQAPTRTEYYAPQSSQDEILLNVK